MKCILKQRPEHLQKKAGKEPGHYHVVVVALDLISCAGNLALNKFHLGV